MCFCREAHSAWWALLSWRQQSLGVTAWVADCTWGWKMGHSNSLVLSSVLSWDSSISGRPSSNHLVPLRCGCKLKAGRMRGSLFASFLNSEPVPFHPSEETKSVLLMCCCCCCCRHVLYACILTPPTCFNLLLSLFLLMLPVSHLRPGEPVPAGYLAWTSGLTWSLSSCFR